VTDWPSGAVTDIQGFVDAFGRAGVTLLDAADAALVPTAFVAVTVNV
jgi:hypothetical protein